MESECGVRMLVVILVFELGFTTRVPDLAWVFRVPGSESDPDIGTQLRTPIRIRNIQSEAGTRNTQLEPTPEPELQV